MIATITSHKTITSKKGVVWHIFHYLLPSGETGSFMMANDSYSEQEVPEGNLSVNASVFPKANVDLEFDNNKRVVSLSAL